MPWVLMSFTTVEHITTQQITLICTRYIHGVFVSLFKIAMFHGIASWFCLSCFELDFPFSIGLLSAVTCLVDERLVLLCLAPAALQLWAHPGDGLPVWCPVWIGSLLPIELSSIKFWTFCGVSLWRCLGAIGANIFRGNTPDLHPLIIGWSVFGGISLFGASGAITGPLVATLPFMLRELFQLYKGWLSSPNHPKSPSGPDSPLCEPKRLFNPTQGEEGEVLWDSRLPQAAVDPRSTHHYEACFDTEERSGSNRVFLTPNWRQSSFNEHSDTSPTAENSPARSSPFHPHSFGSAFNRSEGRSEGRSQSFNHTISAFNTPVKRDKSDIVKS